MFKRWIKLVILCFSLVFMHGTALATVAVHSSFPVSVRVYTNTPAVNFQQKLDVLVVFDIQKPWHILSPKNVDVGLPTKISWSLPEGYVLSSESWSFEQVFPSEFGPQYGFSDKAFSEEMTRIREDNDRIIFETEGNFGEKNIYRYFFSFKSYGRTKFIKKKAGSFEGQIQESPEERL